MKFAPVEPEPLPQKCTEEKNPEDEYCRYGCQLDTCYLRWLRGKDKR